MIKVSHIDVSLPHHLFKNKLFKNKIKKKNTIKLRVGLIHSCRKCLPIWPCSTDKTRAVDSHNIYNLSIPLASTRTVQSTYLIKSGVYSLKRGTHANLKKYVTITTLQNIITSLRLNAINNIKIES